MILWFLKFVSVPSYSITNLYTQYIKKRNRYIFADNLSNFEDVHSKLAGYIDQYVCH